MILSIVSILFAGYLSSCSRGSVSAETTAVLLGGRYDDGKTESYPCDVEIGDIGSLDGLGAAVLNGQIVYCGGMDASGEYRRNCYKNEGGDWIEFESMRIDREYFTLTTLGDKILAAGGDTYQGLTATVEVFDGSSWKLQNYELTSARYGHCAVPISESQVMLLGGYRDSPYGGPLSLVEIYSIDEGFLSKLPSMPTARYGLACSMFKGEIWTAGGYRGYNEYLDVVEILTPGEFINTWRSGPKLTRGRYHLTMEVLDNSLVVFGGTGDLDSLMILEGEKWREEPLQYGHSNHASVTIQCN